MWSADWLRLLTNVWIQPSNFCLSHRLRLIWKIGLSVIQDQKSQGKSGNLILEWKVKAFRNEKSIKGGGQKIRLNHINRRTNAPETKTWSYRNVPSSWRILSHSFLKHESPSWRGDLFPWSWRWPQLTPLRRPEMSMEKPTGLYLLPNYIHLAPDEPTHAQSYSLSHEEWQLFIKPFPWLHEHTSGWHFQASLEVRHGHVTKS